MVRLVRFILLFTFQLCYGQYASIGGQVRLTWQEKVVEGWVILEGTDFRVPVQENGYFQLRSIPYGKYTLLAFASGTKLYRKEIMLNSDLSVDIVLEDLETDIEAIVIEAERERILGIARLKSVDDFGIYEGKKSEVIELNNLVVNFATNNARQIYARVTGLNIWENDQAGLQLSIGSRGLNPNRTANFNVRQNGYDISADALGYPESYYTPPAEALERIEIIRGAASLQYGTQFGGMLNFRFKQASDKKIGLISRQSLGAWGFWSSFNSLSGKVGRFKYYTYYLHKQGQGYRPNSAFKYHNFYFSGSYSFSKKLSADLQLTKMHYLAQQPGGLTDRAFQENPRQSLRSRNWFSVDWNLLALLVDYNFNRNTKLNIRNFGLFAQRWALGNLERANVADFGKERNLIVGNFQNLGSEVRLLHQYRLSKQTNTLLLGARIYRGVSSAQQGWGTNGSDANFSFLNPNDVEDSNYQFPNFNHAFFTEHIFVINKKFSITPGLRYENIQTFANGYYKRYVRDGAGNIIVQDKITENLQRKRNFIIAGVGVSYRFRHTAELYANFTQNYRAINFSDLRINNPNLRIDANLQDEKGFTADLGLRGKAHNLFNYEVTFFWLQYNQKIGQVLRTDTVLFNDYRFRTNVSDARNVGIEAFGECSILPLFGKESSVWKCSVFANFALIDARYIRTQESAIRGRMVEMVPPITLRLGSSLFYKEKFSTTFQYSYTAEHFSDATNARRTASAIEGLIPAYSVMDWSFAYEWKFLRAELSINNLLNTKYFTRRADGYPGPGIIPADGRGFYGTLQVKW